MAKRYSELRALLIRALAAQQVFEESWPSTFLSWAKLYGVPLDERLSSAVVNDGQTMKHWYDMAQEYKQRAAVAQAELTRMTLRAAELEKDLCKQAEALKSDKAGEKAGHSNRTDRPSALTLKYRTAAKALFGLAKRHYGLDFEGGRKPNLQRIVADLAGVGVNIDDQSLRGHLLVGSEVSSKY